MKHEKTIIHFTDKNKSYRVEYDYSNTADRNVLVEKKDNESYGWESDELQARIFENEECIKLFNPLPYTKTNNPTKTQAKELIKLALKSISVTKSPKKRLSNKKV